MVGAAGAPPGGGFGVGALGAGGRCVGGGITKGSGDGVCWAVAECIEPRSSRVVKSHLGSIPRSDICVFPQHFCRNFTQFAPECLMPTPMLEDLSIRTLKWRYYTTPLFRNTSPSHAYIDTPVAHL